MIKYVILVVAVISNSLAAQKIVFSDAAFKSKLLTSSEATIVARNLSNDYFAIDSNNNGEIEVQEAEQVAHLEVDNASISSLEGIENFTNLVSLQCSNNQISNLNISVLKKLTDLDCNSNLLTTLTIAGASNLEKLYCQSNLLESLNASNLINLIVLECSQNKLKSLFLIGLTNLQSLFCSGNVLTSLNVNDLSSLLTLECSRNAIATLDFSKIVNVENLNCNYNQLTNLDVSFLLDLYSLECTNNQLSTLKLDGLSRLVSLNCNNNMIKTLKVNTLFSLTFFSCKNNVLESLSVAGLGKLKVLDFSINKITTINLLGLTKLVSLFCANNALSQIDATNQIEFQSLDASNNLLTSLFLKNGSNESNGVLLLSGNSGLTYICADEAEVDFVSGQVANYGYTNCEVNSYCSFVPGGNYNVVDGQIQLDSNLNGCDALDSNFPKMNLIIKDDFTSVSTSVFADSVGFYTTAVNDGSYTITPVIENPSYYKISPSLSKVVFPSSSSPVSLNYCIMPNGSHNDLEIILIPLDNPQSNFESKYKIIYKNKGTTTQTASVNLIFDVSALNLVATRPLVSSQNAGVLKWNFSNLLPQETRTIYATFKVNSTINNGYVLHYKAAIINANDENPIDNNLNFSQFVGNNNKQDNKICLEGSTISSSQAGNYLHYIIRFENSGSSVSRNIVVKDSIDISKFDITTLVPLDGSHSFSTRITSNSNVEFIFENINLPFDKGNNIGYVVFKVKTLADLDNGAVIDNVANIYFDNTKPILTNTASTSIQNLKIKDDLLSERVIIYPNPVKNILHIQENNQIVISSVEIYDILGQLVQSKINSDGNIKSIDVSTLKNGLYIIRLNGASGITTSKFLKE